MTESRRWTAKKVGQAACQARENGYTVDALLFELDKCAPCQQQRRRRNVNSQTLMAVADNNLVLERVDIVLTGIELAANTFLLLSRFVPQLRTAGLALSSSLNSITVVQFMVRARKAANDELYDTLARELRDAA